MLKNSEGFALSPSQRHALDQVIAAQARSSAVVLLGAPGIGMSTILGAAHAALGGSLLRVADFLDLLPSRHPLALEEAFLTLVRDAMAQSEIVFLDDLHLIANVVCCSHTYPRQNLLLATLEALHAEARATGRRLVFASERSPIPMMWSVAEQVSLMDFRPEDYRAICGVHLPEAGNGHLDFERIHRFAKRLNARQLASTARALAEKGVHDTDAFLDYLRTHHLITNVDLGEVQAVDLATLRGIDDVIRALEANIILPLENAALSADLNLKPKRGVLLAGPPGTGKTTIGRALAHRLKGKFFLIDGTFIAGTDHFYQRVSQVFEAAKHSAPCVIFLDDSDVIFEGGDTGLYRYLLTMLDGLESETAGQVCVMMTAMDVGSLPPALVRSGRIELWLEMRMPDEEARAAILGAHCAGLPAMMGPIDVSRVAAATEGLSGADLKRLVEDGKILYAYDRSRDVPTRRADDYLLSAVETVRANKERYAEAEARARANRPARPAFFDIPAMAMGLSNVVFAERFETGAGMMSIDAG